MHRTDFSAIRHQMARIVALLLALAVDAECVCGAPRAVRFYVLSILLPAQSAALDFVCGEAGLPTPADTDVADLAVVAVRFRLLAFILAYMEACLSDGAPRGARVVSLCSRHDAAGGRGDRQAARLENPFDTS